MTFDFATDNGPPCHACAGTIYTYRVSPIHNPNDLQPAMTAAVSADCVGCRARYPRAFDFTTAVEITAAVLSGMHRRHWHYAA